MPEHPGDPGSPWQDQEHPADWWWCLQHGRVEPHLGCPNKTRLGPFASSEEAAGALQRAHERTQRWDEDEQEWAEGGGGARA